MQAQQPLEQGIAILAQTLEVPSWHKAWHFPAVVCFCSCRPQMGRICRRQIHAPTAGNVMAGQGRGEPHWC